MCPVYCVKWKLMFVVETKYISSMYFEFHFVFWWFTIWLPCDKIIPFRYFCHKLYMATNIIINLGGAEKLTAINLLMVKDHQLIYLKDEALSGQNINIVSIGIITITTTITASSSLSSFFSSFFSSSSFHPWEAKYAKTSRPLLTFFLFLQNDKSILHSLEPLKRIPQNVAGLWIF